MRENLTSGSVRGIDVSSQVETWKEAINVYSTTVSQRQLRNREATWEGSRRQDLRADDPPSPCGLWRDETETAYKARPEGEPAQHGEALLA
jgi:hypothetical protein